HYIGLEEALAAGEAAQEAGIELVLLYVAYGRGGTEKFRQESVAEYLRGLERLRDAGLRVGVAPHSVRACPADWLEELGRYAAAGRDRPPPGRPPRRADDRHAPLLRRRRRRGLARARAVARRRGRHGLRRAARSRRPLRGPCLGLLRGRLQSHSALSSGGLRKTRPRGAAGSASRRFGSRSSRRATALCASSRARCIPMQTCGPCAKARWSFAFS